MGYGVKIIMVSGILQGTDVSESHIRMKADADAFLNKPFQMKDLVSKVKDLLAD
jgi:hypothetical protein